MMISYYCSCPSAASHLQNNRKSIQKRALNWVYWITSTGVIVSEREFSLFVMTFGGEKIEI
jgi:hypothetical protein